MEYLRALSLVRKQNNKQKMKFSKPAAQNPQIKHIPGAPCIQNPIGNPNEVPVKPATMTTTAAQKSFVNNT